MSKTSWRILTLAETLALAIYIAFYIWKLQAAYPNSWFVFPVCLVASIFLHRDTPKTLGWRGDNLWPAILQGWKVFLAMVAAALAIGFFFSSYHQWPVHWTQAQRLLSYSAFCFLQQVALNSYTTNRLLYTFEDPRASSLLAGFIFAALHWPNPVLVPLTFFGGAIMSWLFSKERNIIPLAIGQAIIGTLIWWAFPSVWHHGMRVGPGFYTYRP